VLRRPLGRGRQIVRGVHEREVREGLGKVAEHRAALWIELFRQETDVVPHGQQTFEEPLRIDHAPHLGVGVRQPEAAGEEHPFPRRETVGRLAALRAIAKDEAVGHEVLLDRFDRTGDPPVGRW
jgi:hypothetical protein